jgi:membrane protein DedA with SNARE-associated domain
MHHFLEKLHDQYAEILNKWSYWAVAFLMALESTLVPIPSELIIPPAAYKAWDGGGLAIFGTNYTGWTAEIILVIAGTLGSWI